MILMASSSVGMVQAFVFLSRCKRIRLIEPGPCVQPFDLCQSEINGVPALLGAFGVSIAHHGTIGKDLFDIRRP